MTFAYGEESRWADQYFMKDEALPNATAKESAALQVGATNGALKYVISAVTAVSIPASATLTATILESDDNQTFVENSSFPQIVFGGTAKTDFAAGDVLGELILPNCKQYVKIKLTSSGASTGSINVWLGYLAR